ncbi:DNA-directed RNA polymerases II, IV and V subunit 9B-like [Panicum virgatum]|uniref:TFIIS-type domain-containing protein n=1 Tax=Panicum virgatum TaxID=38727 RepID=A0A8T0QCX3_PANVG|nr:DNA-directed RNA polymerases II, IV and V subunit 9B-like [Panicum virgatum]KAG2571058.1 hypothetical protein PVAP13_7KG032200 [Panicum virgatum]
MQVLNLIACGIFFCCVPIFYIVPNTELYVEILTWHTLNSNPTSAHAQEDRDRRTLFFACRNCEHQDVSDNNCVYRNEVHDTAGERTQVLQDVAADPTLPRTKTVCCALCGHGEAVFFQATARGEEGMTLFFVCCSPDCGHRWRE